MLLLVMTVGVCVTMAADLPMYECQEGWTLAENICLLAPQESGSWFDGQRVCNEMEASLATIASEEQQQAAMGESTYCSLY